MFGPRLAAAEQYVGCWPGPAWPGGCSGPARYARLWTRHMLNCAAVAGPGAPAVHPGRPGLGCRAARYRAGAAAAGRRGRRCWSGWSGGRLSSASACRAGPGQGPRSAGPRPRTWPAVRRRRGDGARGRPAGPAGRPGGGLVRPGGLVLAIKGAAAAQEVAKAEPVLRRLGMRDVAVVRVGDGKVDPLRQSCGWLLAASGPDCGAGRNAAMASAGGLGWPSEAGAEFPVGAFPGRTGADGRVCG